MLLVQKNRRMAGCVVWLTRSPACSQYRGSVPPIGWL